MLRFLTDGGATFTYDVDFEREPFANLSFFAENRRDILFHLSLRSKTGLAVTNTRLGGRWTGERMHHPDLRPGLNRVAIAFAEAGVTVTLNGEPLLETPAGDLPRLADTRLVNWSGAVIPESVEIGGAANALREGHGALLLEAPFAVTGWAFDPSRPVQRPGIAVEGLDEGLRVHVTAAPERARELDAPTEMLALRASLPGRIWRAAAPDEPVLLRAMANGLPCGQPLALTREAVVAQIEEIAARLRPEADPFAALTTIEHVRFGGLWGALSGAARRYVVTAARLYNVTGWLFPDGLPAEAQEAEEAPAAAPEALLVRRLRQALRARLTEDPQADPAAVLAALLEDWPLGGAARLELVLSLVEGACQSGRPGAVEGLARLTADLPLDPGHDSWQDALRLPPILLRDGLEAAARHVQLLVDRKDAWISPAVVGWTLEHLAGMQTDPWDDRHIDPMLRGLMGLAERIARGYWRAPCAALIRGVVAQLGHGAQVSDGTAQMIREHALRAFGALPEFWRAVAAREAEGRLQPGPRLDSARRAFAILEDETAGPAALDAALRHMRAQGLVDATRLRLELVGPEGVPRTGEGALDPDMAQTATGMIPAEMALRSLAFPGNTLDSPRLAETARQALSTRWNNTDKSACYSVQKQAAAGIAGLLAQLRAGAPDEALTAALQGLQPVLRRLSGQENGFLGLGLTLLVAEALERHGATALAERLLAQLVRLRAEMPAPAPGAIARAPALRSALARVERAVAGRRSEVLEAALALFPERQDATGLYPETPRTVPGQEGASPLFDTLVTVFSCKPYLDSRVAAMRDGWLRDLAEMGIPFVVVVGDGDGRLEGDVLHLDAPDDYEGLPQKTLAAVRWVYENTGFDHMLKIDDDCFLNVAEYFGSLSYRKFDYYGRGLTRTLGEMSRTWHHEKSRSDRARSELDKSPEPASYADGGGGYALSRPAMRALLEAADSPEGWRLIDSGYMEDKMVGDLLATRGITVATEDYYTTIWRRTHGKARQIMLWDNYFLPSAASPCKMAHLDTADAQAPTHARAGSTGLFPRKLWPTSQHATLGYNSNQLELLSDESTLFRLNKADLAVICTCRNEAARLPRFLDHYRRLGVECFLFVDNASDDGSREYLLEQPDCAVFSADTTYAAGRYGLTWQMTLMAQLRLGRWSLVADADELVVFRRWQKGGLARLVSEQARGGADAFCLPMIDMYPKGDLAQAELGADPFAVAGFTDRAPVQVDPQYRGVFSNDRTRVSAVRHRLLPEARGLTFLAQKYALVRYRPWMRLSEGLHFASQVTVGPEVFALAHFKYDAGFAARVAEETTRGQHFNNAEEYRMYARLMAGEGGLTFWQEGVSVPWQESEVAKAVLG